MQEVKDASGYMQEELRAQAMEVYRAVMEGYEAGKEREKKLQVPGSCRIVWGPCDEVVSAADVQAFARSIQKLPARQAKYKQ